VTGGRAVVRLTGAHPNLSSELGGLELLSRVKAEARLPSTAAALVDSSER